MRLLQIFVFFVGQILLYQNKLTKIICLSIFYLQKLWSIMKMSKELLHNLPPTSLITHLVLLTIKLWSYSVSRTRGRESPKYLAFCESFGWGWIDGVVGLWEVWSFSGSGTLRRKDYLKDIPICLGEYRTCHIVIQLSRRLLVKTSLNKSKQLET